MAAPSESWNVISTSQTDADSPLDTTLMEAIRQNLIHLEEWLGLSYTAAQNHDHDNVNSKTVILGDRSIAAVKIVADSLTSAEIANNAITANELANNSVEAGHIATDAVGAAECKFASGTWSTLITFGDIASVDLVDYSHMPKQAISGAINIWYSDEPLSSEAYRIFAQNISGSTNYTWSGTYHYHTNSEQIIVTIKDKSGIVVGVHVTEVGNENSIKRYDAQKNELIGDSLEVLTIATNPSLFISNKEKKVISTAQDLIKTPKQLEIEIPVI